MQTLRLPNHLEKAVLSGHPWLYRDQLPRGFRGVTGQWVRLLLGKVTAFALMDADSALALRVFSREQPPDARWVAERVRAAWQLRQSCLDLDATSAFRWLNGEGDLLPGIVVDYYAGYAVIALDSPACDVLLPWLIDAMTNTTRLTGILCKGARSRTHGEARVVYGTGPSEECLVRENGLWLEADLARGQKTGLFLDHRDNRRQIETLAGGRRVLNLFAYTGGFSLYAARGGALRVTSVDVSEGAIEAAKRNFERNGFAAGDHEFVVADVFDYLETVRQGSERFDLLICDPPSFGSSQAKLSAALSAYARLHSAGLKVTAQDALYAAASCTARVTPLQLRQTLADAARRARRQFQVLADNGHAPDHPISVAHPEGRYLKFILGRVGARV